MSGAAYHQRRQQQFSFKDLSTKVRKKFKKREIITDKKLGELKILEELITDNGMELAQSAIDMARVVFFDGTGDFGTGNGHAFGTHLVLIPRFIW